MVKNIDTASDWLNMFTKVSERLYLAFISKMPKRTAAQQQHYNEQRRANKSKTRQAVFISEFVQSKYFDVYSEACRFFNALNTLYATKYDLRKTSEFRLWKSSINGEVPKAPKRTCHTYLNIEKIQQTSTVPQSPSQPQSPTATESPPPQTPTESSPPQSPTTTESSPPQSPTVTEISSPQSPTATESSPPQSPTVTEISSPQSPTATESSPPQSPTATESPPTKFNDTLELKIPLLRYNTPEKSTVTTQTLDITTIQETDLVTLNDFPDEKINEIIEQLRRDPDLTDIFTTIEQQIEFEELGMDLEIPELNSLEDELFW